LLSISGLGIHYAVTYSLPQICPAVSQDIAHALLAQVFPVTVAVGTTLFFFQWILSVLSTMWERLIRRNDELLVANSKATEASRAKSQFVATMSHEIRTPLNAILNLTEVVLQSGQLDVQFQDMISKVHVSGKVREL